MPVPGDPTTLTVAANAARLGGLRNASSVSYAVTTYAPDWFESVKSQLWQASTNDKLLETTTVLLTAVGSRRLGLDFPTDFDHERIVRAWDGSTEDGYRGTFRAIGTGAVQLAAAFSGAATASLGMYIFTLSGVGRGQAQSIASFNETNKWATLDAAYATAPLATTTYLVGQRYWDLAKQDYEVGRHGNGPPTRYRLVATTMEVEPPSDLIYPLQLFYGANLTRLNDGGYTFVRHLRERYAYWVQGLKVEVMGQFAQANYEQELTRWEAMKLNYGAKNIQYERSGFDR